MMWYVLTVDVVVMNIQIVQLFIIYVSGSSKIQTFCPMTQVPLKLRFTVMERLSVY